MDKNLKRQGLKNLLALKGKFALSGLVATSIDYVLYLLLVGWFFSPVISNIISYSLAVILNFSLQRRYVFSMQRPIPQAFLMSVGISAGGLGISTGLIHFFSQVDFFAERQYVAKLLTTGLVFFYNFYLKRYAFEKRFF